MIYAPRVAEGYEWLNCVNELDYEVLRNFDGSPQLHQWRPLRVVSVLADEGQVLTRSEFPWLTAHAIAMRQPACDVLSKMFLRAGELLPLEADEDSPLFVLNVTQVLDALDEEASTIARFPSTNRIMHIERYVFHTSIVRNIDIFRLPYRVSPTYVSERFVDAVRASGLKGLEFDKIWSL